MNKEQASAGMSAARRAALVVGVLYLVTHVTSIVAGVMYGPILEGEAYITGSGPDTQAVMAAFLEGLLVIAIVGTGAGIYPYLKRQNEGVALSYLLLRTSEAVIISAGIIPLLVMVSLRQQFAGTAGVDPSSLGPLGGSLAEFHNWTHVLATNLIYGAHTVLLAYLLYKSGLVARFIPVLCLIGGPAVFILGTAKMFGVLPGDAIWVLFAAAAAFAWELSLALWLILKGFNRVAVAPGSEGELGASAANENLSAA